MLNRLHAYMQRLASSSESEELAVAREEIAELHRIADGLAEDLDRSQAEVDALRADLKAVEEDRAGILAALEREQTKALDLEEEVRRQAKEIHKVKAEAWLSDLCREEGYDAAIKIASTYKGPKEPMPFKVFLISFLLGPAGVARVSFKTAGKAIAEQIEKEKCAQREKEEA